MLTTFTCIGSPYSWLSSTSFTILQSSSDISFNTRRQETKRIDITARSKPLSHRTSSKLYTNEKNFFYIPCKGGTLVLSHRLQYFRHQSINLLKVVLERMFCPFHFLISFDCSNSSDQVFLFPSTRGVREESNNRLIWFKFPYIDQQGISIFFSL